MNKYEELIQERKKINKFIHIVGIILGISIIAFIFCITSIKNPIFGTIPIVTGIVSIILLKGKKKELEEIEKDIHDIEIIKAANEKQK